MKKNTSKPLPNKEMKRIIGGAGCWRCDPNPCTCECCICKKQVDQCTCGTVNSNEIT